MTNAITVPVALKDVERELSRQVKKLHPPSEHVMVLRARMANLVIATSSQEQAAVINSQLAEVMAYHPARVILLIGEPHGGDDRHIKASVTIRPLQVGRNETAYGEQITFEAGGPLIDRLSFAVRANIIGDLPTNLWWASTHPPALAGSIPFDLAEGADQIMYDSIGWPDPTRGVAATGRWLAQIERYGLGGRQRLVSDLNWRRLKYWRRLLVQSLAPASAPGVADSAREIVVEHGPHAVVQAWLLASWLTLRLGWKVEAGRIQANAEMVWRCHRSKGEGRVRLHRLESGAANVRRVWIACRLGDVDGAINIVADSDIRLNMTLEGIEAAARTITLPPHPDAEMIGRQLSDRENSPAFRDSMNVAQVMAQSLLH
jgi:glucose-6-phosphate dehydrogenase assembly protein OpcA